MSDSNHPERDTVAAYDAIAEWYDRLVVDGQSRQEGARRALFELVGSVQGQRVCDLGCGQGVISRELAGRGASVVGVDLSQSLLEIARRHDEQHRLQIQYVYDDARHLHSIVDAVFDGVVCNLALMDMPHLPAVLGSVYRVAKPGGWFVLAITHPCFQAPHSDWIEHDGELVRVLGDYNAEGFWRSDDPAGVRGRVGAHHRMISTYLNAVIDAGFLITKVEEPRETPQVERSPTGWTDLPLTLLIRCVKPSS